MGSRTDGSSGSCSGLQEPQHCNVEQLQGAVHTMVRGVDARAPMFLLLRCWLKDVVEELHNLDGPDSYSNARDVRLVSVRNAHLNNEAL